MSSGVLTRPTTKVLIYLRTAKLSSIPHTAGVGWRGDLVLDYEMFALSDQFCSALAQGSGLDWPSIWASPAVPLVIGEAGARGDFAHGSYRYHSGKAYGNRCIHG
jgi:hypothetical protein